MGKTTAASWVALLAALMLAGCDSAPNQPADGKVTAAAPAPPPPPPAKPVAPAGLPIWSGDLPSLLDKRVVRMLVVYSKTFYFIDKGQQRGITYDFGMELEKYLNAANKDKTRPVRVIFIPVARDQLLPALAAGAGDIATGALTVTPERMKIVDFTAPAAENISQILVTAPEVTAPASVDELSGRSVFVRRSSACHESLVELNSRLAAAGKQPVEIVTKDNVVAVRSQLEGRPLPPSATPVTAAALPVPDASATPSTAPGAAAR